MAAQRFSIAKIVDLLRIFEHEPTNIYRVAQLPGWNNPSAHRYIHYCLKQGYVEFDHEGDRKGLPAKFYRLTERGLALLASAPTMLPPTEKSVEKMPKKEEKSGTGIFIRTGP